MLSTPSRWYVNLGITIIILVVVVVVRVGKAALINKLKGGGAQDHNAPPPYHHNHLFSPQAQGLDTDKESDANFDDFISSVYGDKNVPAK